VELHVLVVEDSDDDAELVLRRLRENGYSPRADRVATEAALAAALARRTWDVALVDYNLPGFGGPAALRLLAEVAPDLPAITVSGAISEETAVATLTAGAVDYVLKDNMTRLAPAVRRAVDGAALRRRQRSDAERARMTQSAIDHSSQTIAYVKEDGTILYANAAAGRLCEAPLATLTGSRIWDWLSIADEERWAALWRETVERPPVQVEASVETTTGAVRRVAVTLDHLGAADGAFVVAYARDITERKRAEESLRESEAQLRTLVDTLPDVVWLKDPEGVYLLCNRRFEDFCGAREEDIVGKTDRELLSPELADFFRAHDRAAMDAGGPTANEEEIVFASDGHHEILETIKTPVRARDGRIIGVLGVGRDITDRKRSEEALRESEERFRRVSEATSDFSYSCVRRAGGTFAFDWLTGAVQRITGWSREELLEWGCWKRLVVAADVPVFETQVVGLAPGESSVCELRITDREGNERWLAAYSRVELDESDTAVHRLHGACQDITARKRAEEDKERSHALLANLARLVPGVVYQYRLYPDGSSAFPYSSPGMSTIYEVSPEEVREDATPVFGRLHPDDHDRVSADIMHSARTLETFYCEFRVVLPRQGLRWRWSQAHPERTEDGGTLWHGIISDITERKVAEEEILRQAEQLRRTVQGAVFAMSHVVEMRDPYTAGHERRVAELAVAMGAELGLAGDELEALRLAALIHDIGKIAVPAEILAKPGRLSEVEFNLIRQHPASGYDILEAIDFGRPVAEYVLQHHERLDGSGYPRGLAGSEVLPEARIIAVADVVEAMSSHRPYRAALGLDAGLDEVCAHAGERYDADVVAACVRLFREQGFSLTA
jgi:PAS domain S-box-containing protein/putative nucleotidyltransferase with HDIG domain